MIKTYFISDLHFNHKNIIKYEPIRIPAIAEYMVKKNKYQTIEEATKWITDHLEIYTEDDLNELLYYHDNMLIDKWNSKVKKDDIVWFLGDLGMGNKDYIKECVSKLNGKKKIVLGNHDNLPISYYEDCGFTEVIPRKRQVIIKDFFVLSHKPSAWMNPNSSPYFYIYGHVHSMPQYVTKTENSQCVCVERQNFEPIEIPEYTNYVAQEEELDPHKSIKENM